MNLSKFDKWIGILAISGSAFHITPSSELNVCYQVQIRRQLQHENLMKGCKTHQCRNEYTTHHRRKKHSRSQWLFQFYQWTTCSDGTLRDGLLSVCVLVSVLSILLCLQDIIVPTIVSMAMIMVTKIWTPFNSVFSNYRLRHFLSNKNIPIYSTHAVMLSIAYVNSCKKHHIILE